MRSIIFYKGTWTGCGLDIHGSFSRTTVDGTGTRGIDPPPEGAFQIGLRIVVGQHVVGLKEDIISQTAQSLVVESTTQDAIVALAVANCIIHECDLVRTQEHLHVAHVIVGIERRDMDRTTRTHIASKVDIAQGADDTHPSVAPQMHIVEEGVGERLNEVEP